MLHLIFALSVVGFAAIRIAYGLKARREAGPAEYREGWRNWALRASLAVPYMLAVLAYLPRPDLLAWAQLPLPEWARWVGAALSLAGVGLLWWVHAALGANFSSTLHLRERHTLVIHGPYRWVRHPMYTVFYVCMLGWLLLTANWIIGLLPMVGLTAIVAARVRREEATMIEKFGDAYRGYMQRTGRFLPRVV